MEKTVELLDEAINRLKELKTKTTTSENIRAEYKKDKEQDCFAYRQEFAGAKMEIDGFSDEYVGWLELKIIELSMSS